MKNRVVGLRVPSGLQKIGHKSGMRTSNKTDKLVESFSSSNMMNGFSISEHRSNLDLDRTPKPKSPNSMMHEIAYRDKKINELAEKNSDLTRQLTILEQENKRLAKQNATLQAQSTPPLKSEIRKYANFVQNGIEEAPVLKELMLDRLGSIDDFIQALNHNRDKCLFQLLQVTSDLIVQEVEDSPETRKKKYCHSLDMDSFRDDSDSLFDIINHQADRINKLNRQISDAMNSSKEILHSPVSRKSKLPNSASYKKTRLKNK